MNLNKIFILPCSAEIVKYGTDTENKSIRSVTNFADTTSTENNNDRTTINLCNNFYSNDYSNCTYNNNLEFVPGNYNNCSFGMILLILLILLMIQVKIYI